MMRRRLGRLFFSPQMRSLVLQIPILISSADTPGSSTRIEINFSVSQRSTGGAHVPDTSGFSASGASCRGAERRPTRSRRRCSSSRSNPVARNGLIIANSLVRKLLLLTRRSAGPGANEMFELSHELRYIFKLEIHRGETNICDFVQFFQASHDHLADFTGRTFAFGRFLHVLFDRIDDAVEFG